jgi:hypothetical protein
MRRTLFLSAAVLSLAACAESDGRVFGPSAAPRRANAHFVGSNSCTQDGTSLLCSFKVAGLGNAESVDIEVQAAYSCSKMNGGSNFVEPGGLASASQADVPVRSGQVTLTDFLVSAGKKKCPRSFEADFGDFATVFVNGTSVGTIPIS